ncbi:MAG: hypothetical protein NTX00_04555 [Candidatus Parcubacteria bacterium]|nr:hypothetical protein [Candidatus Parcubacteria bacterium]
MSNFEQQLEQPIKPSFDYKEAALLARQKLELEGSQDKQKKAHVKREIKETYGAEGQPERRIFDLEIAKQRLELEKVQSLAEGGIKLKVEKRMIDYDKQAHDFDFPTEKGFSQKVSKGDLMTDINWGLYYELGNDAPPQFKEQYIKAVYDKEIAKFYDQQLIIQRTELERGEIDEFLFETYKKVGAALEKGGEESAGLLFEKMIKNILSKVAFDFKKYGLKIEEPPDRVIGDVEGKIDFIIKHKKNRAVKIEDTNKAEGMEETLNIQFTLKGYDTEEFAKKQRQVARALKENHNIHDLILISVPVEHDVIFGNYKKWQKHDKLPGGPENCFKSDVIVNFIKEILKNTELVGSDEFLKDVQKYFEGKR